MKILKKEYCGIKLYWFLFALALATIGIIAGSFVDLNLSKALYDPYSGYGNFVETFGMAIGYMMAPFGGTILFLGLYKNKKLWLRIVGYVVLVLSLLVATYMFGNSIGPKEEYGLTTGRTLGYVFSLLCMGLASILAVLLADQSDEKQLIKVGLIILFTMVFQLVLLNLFLKYLAGRPRYRYLMGNAEDLSGLSESFRSWWELQPFKYTSGDYHKSWPSGHTATATVTLTLAFASTIAKKKWRYLGLSFFLLGLAYTIVVAFARIVAGAHFLSDVSFGCFFSTLGAIIGMILIEGFGKKIEGKGIKESN